MDATVEEELATTIEKEDLPDDVSMLATTIEDENLPDDVSIVYDEKPSGTENRMEPDQALPDLNGDESIKIAAVEMEEPIVRLVQKAPPINCMEKIIFLVDISSEMSNSSFSQTKASSPLTFMQYFQRTIDIFLATKKILNPLHQYALALLQNDAVFWYQEFTNDAKLIEEMIMDLEPADDAGDGDRIFSFDHIVQILKDHCELPTVTDIVLPPPYIVRCILVFGRSNCDLRISSEGKDMLNELKKSPYFFMDVLYMHDAPSSENKAKEIYDFFCHLDKEELGYVLEVSNSIQWMYENVAKLLSHPLQRCQQNEAFYHLMPQNNDSLLDKA